jgi:hypothetical protein
MVAPFNIVYNTVYDIIFRAIGVMPTGGQIVQNRGIDGRKTTQTRDSAAD